MSYTVIMSVETFQQMVGETFTRVDDCRVGSESMAFVARDGAKFQFHYEADCCANCSIEDVIGDVEDLVGVPLLVAEEVSSDNEPPPGDAESYTWTFYRFATIKGSVTIRWLGTSNGFTYTPPSRCDEHDDCRNDRAMARSCYALSRAS